MSATRKIPIRAQTANTSSGPPVGEMGRVNTPGVLPWATFAWIDQLEYVPDLIWPTSIRTYNQMRNDSQVNGLYLGVTLPIRRYNWVVALNNAREEVARGLAEDLGLPLQGEERKLQTRFRDRFNWDDFMRHGLLALAYGYYYFEQSGIIKPGVVNGKSVGKPLWRLNAIAPRPPATVTKVDVDDQGGLVSIKQSVGTVAPDIPANRLVPFSWDREGGNWFGRSIFRHMYKHWLLKDRLLRVDAMKHERNGLGVPWIEAPQGATRNQLDDLNALAQAFRAGEYAGASIPYGAKLHLAGVEGALPDTLASINYQDEAMARALLMMFVQLGQTMHGSRALGDSFIDYFNIVQDMIATWFQTTVNEYVTENWVNWNYGEAETCPLVLHEQNPEPHLAVADLVNLIESGAITVDPDLEAYIRERYMLPPKSVTQLPQPGGVGTPELQNPSGKPDDIGAPSNVTKLPTVVRRKGTVQAGFDNSLLPLPDRPLRRQMYTQEVQASVDYKQMDADYATAKMHLVADVKAAQAKQIAQLREKITAADNDLTKLSQILADPVHAYTIQARMVDIATTGAHQAINEAQRQSVTINMPDLTATIAQLSTRANAVDGLLARSLSEAAARKAISLSGTVKTPAEVATQTATYLTGLSDSYLQDQLGGTLQQAMNAGRKAVIDSGPSSQVYASELLDSNTCDECMDIDGTEYPDIDSAEADYPTGGYMECAGGPRCRGTLIAVYSEMDTAA